MRFFLPLIVFAVLVSPGESRAGIRLADIGFEVSGGVGDISPTDFNRLLAVYDAHAVTSVYGVGAAVVLPIGERFRASVGSGYFRSKGGEGTMVIARAPDPTGVPTPVDFVVESVPLTGAVDFALTNGSPTVTVGAVFEMHFLTVTRDIHEQPVLGFQGDEDSEKATIPGLSVTVGVEWAVTRSIFMGGGVGYRFAKGDMPLFQIPGADYPFDLGGAFATLLIRVHPWRRVSEN
jgi:hypothetical protein